MRRRRPTAENAEDPEDKPGAVPRRQECLPYRRQVCATKTKRETQHPTVGQAFLPAYPAYRRQAAGWTSGTNAPWQVPFDSTQDKPRGSVHKEVLVATMNPPWRIHRQPFSLARPVAQTPLPCLLCSDGCASVAFLFQPRGKLCKIKLSLAFHSTPSWR